MARHHQEMTADEMRAWQGFLRAHRRLIRRLDDELVEHAGISIDYYDVLVQLREADGSLRMGELAQAVLVTAPNCTRLVSKMEADGLVERFVDSGDRRVKLASLTAHGREVLAAAVPMHRSGIMAYFLAMLTPEMAGQLSGIFEAVIATLDGSSEALDRVCAVQSDGLGV